MAYKLLSRGQKYASNYRVFISKDGLPVSPLNDIPLWQDDGRVAHMVVEVPRWSNAKMELDLKSALNPIKQDVKKEKLRFVANCFPHKGYIWNYGALPQTWEDPDHVDSRTECKGDGDPIDVCEIGSAIHDTGSVVSVKILGVLAMIDEGETDWKLIVIDTNDPLADKMNDIQDVETLKPGLIAATVEWFKIYKIPDGKPANKFAFDEQVQNAKFALDVIQQTHEQYLQLRKKALDDANQTGIDLRGTQQEADKLKMSGDEANKEVDKYDENNELQAPLPQNVHHWHHVKA